MAYQHIDINDDDVQELEADAKKYLEENVSEARIPVAYTNDGRYSIRIWPDRDNTGRLRVMKRTFLQKLNNNIRYVHSDAVQALLKEATEAGVKNDKLFQFQSREHGYLMVHVYDVSPENEYIKKDTDICLILNYAGVKAVQTFFAEISVPEKKAIINTRNPSPPLTLLISDRGKSQKIIYDHSTSPVTMGEMVLPDGVDWEGLDRVYIRDDQTVPEEALFDFRKFIGKLVLESKGSDGRTIDLSRRSSTAGQIGVNTGVKDQTAARPRVDTNDPLNPNGVCLLRNDFADDPQLAQEYASNGFGKRPSNAGSLLQCLQCPIETECRVKTEG